MLRVKKRLQVRFLMRETEVIFVRGTNFLVIALHITVLCILFGLHWFINENACGGFLVASKSIRVWFGNKWLESA